jgi:hypothetical protein
LGHTDIGSSVRNGGKFFKVIDLGDWPMGSSDRLFSVVGDCILAAQRRVTNDFFNGKLIINAPDDLSSWVIAHDTVRSMPMLIRCLRTLGEDLEAVPSDLE